MKKITCTLAVVVALLAICSCGTNNEKKVLSSERDTLSWAMGMSLAKTVQTGFYDFDREVVLQAFESCMKDGKQPLDEAQFRQACEMIALLAENAQLSNAQRQTQAASVSQDEYFAKLVKDNPNLKKSDRGFYYEVLSAGSGPKAKAGLRIKFDFRSINMLTGDTITQTYGNREPIVHVVSNSMFEGLYYGLHLMPAGSKYRFYFPYELVKNVPDFPSYTPIIYEVELHEIYKD